MPEPCSQPRLSPTEYADEAGQRCPVCLSDQIEAGSLEAGETQAWQTVRCTACGASWDDVFVLRRYEDLSLPHLKETS
jgi:hypothetical protein